MAQAQGRDSDETGPPLALAALIDRYPWETSPLGPKGQWSPTLRATVDMLLRAHAQIVLFWGPQYVAIYNDAYAPTIGVKHPGALGRPACEWWRELWDDLGPLLRGVRETGATFSARDRPFYIERHGFGETVYFDVSYSAVPEPDGTIGGVLCIVTETTGRVLAQQRLAESERRSRALVDATSDIIYRMNADWTAVTQLDGKDLLANAEHMPAPWSTQFIPEPDRERVDAIIDHAIRTRTPFECEHRIRFRSGELGWVHSRAVPIMDETGTVLEWFGAASDVTQARAQRERLEVVVHELDHRVKNTLAMVQAIALQTFRPGVDLPTAQDTFGERLKAIAEANALLTGERGAGASLRGAIEQAVRPHCPGADRLTLSGKDLALSPKTALAVSLAMHELATNAVKYGAWSGPSGAVALSWSAVRGADAIALTMEWHEHGGPPVAPPARRGFGSKLIERGLAAELNGAVRLAFAPEGVVCSIAANLPVDEVAA